MHDRHAERIRIVADRFLDRVANGGRGDAVLGACAGAGRCEIGRMQLPFVPPIGFVVGYAEYAVQNLEQIVLPPLLPIPGDLRGDALHRVSAGIKVADKLARFPRLRATIDHAVLSGSAVLGRGDVGRTVIIYRFAAAQHIVEGDGIKIAAVCNQRGNLGVFLHRAAVVQGGKG